MKRTLISASVLGLALFGSTSSAESPKNLLEPAVGSKLIQLARALRSVAYPVAYDQLLTLVHKQSATAESRAFVPSVGTPEYEYVMLVDFEQATSEDYMLQIVFRYTKERRFEVLRARLCVGTKSGYVFFLDQDDPSSIRPLLKDGTGRLQPDLSGT
jgi:hypothetical protein